MQTTQSSSENAERDLPRRVRASLGSAMVLGLLKGRFLTEPTTAYLMTYRRGKCVASCGFCPQSRRSRGRRDLLSRISWPAFSTDHVLEGLKVAGGRGKIKRVCLQALNYPGVFAHLCALTKAIREHVRVPISVSCQPLSRENLKSLADAGVERVGIPLDAATREIFDAVKGRSVGGPYLWNTVFELLADAVGIFGRGRVSTHLIVGLGETEKELVGTIQRCVGMGVIPGLFAFTPIPGTPLEDESQPSLQAYRRIQVARHLILHGVERSGGITFDEENQIASFNVGRLALKRITQTGMPFITTGCPDCNRPYYNEKPSGPMYNYPRDLTEREILEAQRQLGID